MSAERPDALIVGPSMCAHAEIMPWLASIVSPHAPGIVLVVDAVTTDVLRAALRSGVSDVVAVSDSSDDLVTAVTRASEEGVRRRPSVQAPVSLAPVARRGRVVTVFSTKGGVGKTVLSINLATALAKKWDKSVALLDLDLQFGDVGIMLGLEPKHTIHDAVQSFDRLDADMIRGFMVEHDSGLSALLAPIRPEEAESVTANRVARILDLLREIADIVVVDTSPAFSDVVLAALDRTDDLYVVTMMDVASIKNTRISLQKLAQLGYDHEMLRLVLNRADSKVFLRTDEVEEAVGAKIAAKIPSDLLVPRSVNKGVPVVLDAPRSDVARSILGIAQDLIDRTESEAEDVA